MENTVAEFLVKKSDSRKGLLVSFLLADGTEIDFRISRDVAINMIQTLYLSLDTHGLYKSKDVH